MTFDYICSKLCVRELYCPCGGRAFCLSGLDAFYHPAQIFFFLPLLRAGKVMLHENNLQYRLTVTYYCLRYPRHL